MALKFSKTPLISGMLSLFMSILFSLRYADMPICACWHIGITQEQKVGSENKSIPEISGILEILEPSNSQQRVRSTDSLKSNIAAHWLDPATFQKKKIKFHNFDLRTPCNFLRELFMQKIIF